MNLHLSDQNERLIAVELERLATAAASDAHETPTLVPPPPDEEPPTVRWTPPPALLSKAEPRRR